MRIEITPVYGVDEDAGTKELVSVRKRIYVLSDGREMFAEWLLDWATGEWRANREMPWNVEINAEMRKRVGWVEAHDGRA